jgi:hypothetical protein
VRDKGTSQISLAAECPSRSHSADLQARWSEQPVDSDSRRIDNDAVNYRRVSEAAQARRPIWQQGTRL